MPRTERLFLAPRNGFRSREAALFVAQLDDILKWLLHDIRDIKPAELSWQPGPGRNTIGMLLAHICIVEVSWTDIGLRGLVEADCPAVLGFARQDDGIPLEPKGKPPGLLKGRSFAWFIGRIKKARGHLAKHAARLTDSDMLGQVERKGRDGTIRIFDRRWVLHHLIDHLSAHIGQIGLIRHEYRDYKES